jgi:hypothetical protein
MSIYSRARGLGEHNAECAVCGFEMSSRHLRKNWRGFHVCPDCFETKPEVFDLRPKIDKQTVPFVQKSKDRYVDPLDNYGTNIRAIYKPRTRDC